MRAQRRNAIWLAAALLAPGCDVAARPAPLDGAASDLAASARDAGADDAFAGDLGAALRCVGLATPPATETWSIDSGGVSRSLIVHVPPAYDATRPLPLVLDFHGQYSNPSQQDMLSKLSVKADAAGFIAIFPAGTGQSWNAGGSCCDPALSNHVDDVGFVRDLLDAAESRLCIDSHAIFATGMSNGAYLVHRLGCDLSDRLAAIAPVAGVLDVPPDCAPARPMPVVEFHGTADPLVPYDGSGSDPSVPATFAGWAARDGCVGSPAQSFANGDATCSRYSQCSGGAEVTLCTITGGGHTWPGGMAVPALGKTSMDLSATDAMWSFFQQHRLP